MKEVKGQTLRGLASFLYKSRRTLLLIVIVVAVTIVSNTVIALWLSSSYDLTVPSVGTIHVIGVEAYGGDLKSAEGVPYVDWGTLQLGDSRRVSFYLRNTGNVRTRLALNVTDWNPEGMGSYITLSWNYNGTQLSPKEDILVVFALVTPDTRDFAHYIASNNIQLYNFTMYIYAQD